MTQQAIARIDREFLLIGRYLTAMARRPDQLDRSATTLLTCLGAGGAMSIGELSTVLGLEVSTLNRQTAALVRAGLADRIADPDGGMARKFTITTEGSRRLREEQQYSRDALRRLMSDWDEESLDDFAQALERLNAAIEDRSGRRWPR